MEKYVLPMEQHYEFYEKWRHELLYSNDVNEIFMVNLNAIRRVYDFISKVADAPKVKVKFDDYKSKYPTIDQILFVLRPRISNISKTSLS